MKLIITIFAAMLAISVNGVYGGSARVLRGADPQKWLSL